MKAIEVKNLTKEYKSFKLDNISFSVEEGKICGFIGENGAGKSTTMKLIADISKPTSGEAYVLGKNIQKFTSLEKEDVAFILDELNFPESYRVYQIEKILKNIFKNWNSELFFSFLEKYNIDKKKKCGELSKGMKVKVNLALSLSHGAKVLILDEPTNGLDPIVRDETLDLFLEHAQNGGTVFISSHIVEDLERICDQIIFIHQGKIILDDSKSEILNLYDMFEVSMNEWNELNKEFVFKYKEEGLNCVRFMAPKGKYDIPGKTDISLNDIMIMIVRGKTL